MGLCDNDESINLAQSLLYKMDCTLMGKIKRYRKILQDTKPFLVHYKVSQATLKTGEFDFSSKLI